MSRQLSAMLLALGLPALAAASPALNARERHYQFLCVPGSALEAEVPAANRRALLAWRAQFAAFAANPGPVVAELAQSPLFQGLGAKALAMQGPLIRQFSQTCGLAHMLAADLRAKGCLSAQGSLYRADTAIALCAPLVDRLQQLYPLEE